MRVTAATTFSTLHRVRAPDAAFADPRLAVLYDVLDSDRTDLDVYEDVVAELRAASVVDIGCGTGTLAVRLAAKGLSVLGVDPAEASLDVARAKPYADQVTWVHGDATAAAALQPAADLALMTGNVAQVFVSDDGWSLTLEAVRRCLRPGGWFVLESRRPAVRDWETWDVPLTTISIGDGAHVTVAQQVTRVALPLVTFESTTRVGGETLRSASTLRFRDCNEIAGDLRQHGFDVIDVREAPDRPGKEYVFLASRGAVRHPRRAWSAEASC